MKEIYINKAMRLVEKGIILETEIIKADYKTEVSKRIKDKKVKK